MWFFVMIHGFIYVQNTYAKMLIIVNHPYNVFMYSVCAVIHIMFILVIGTSMYYPCVSVFNRFVGFEF